MGAENMMKTIEARAGFKILATLCLEMDVKHKMITGDPQTLTMLLKAKLSFYMLNRAIGHWQGSAKN